LYITTAALSWNLSQEIIKQALKYFSSSINLALICDRSLLDPRTEKATATQDRAVELQRRIEEARRKKMSAIASKVGLKSVAGLENNSQMTARERVAQLLKAWPKIYPHARCELDFRNPLQLLVATILSAQSTDRRVNMVTPALFRKYRTAKSYADAPLPELENAIKSTGFYRNKAKSIRGAMREIVEKHGGKVPDTMAELCELPGVGRKTANVVLGNAFHKDEGIVVDTHVIRLSQRLGLTKQKDPVKIELDLMKLVPRQHWTDWSHWLIWHGRRRCYARKPDCSRCEIFKLCPSGKVFLRTGKALTPAENA
jgi:endonuclease III